MEAPGASSRLARRPLRLCLDFDGTITKNDTLSALASVPYSMPSELQPSKPWSEMVDAYISDMTAHTASYWPTEKYRTTIEEEIRWLRSLQSVEECSWNRIERAGIFRHVGREELDTGASRAIENGKVEVHRGWLEMLHRVAEYVDQGAVEVVSVNFSRAWIWFLVCAAAKQRAARLPENLVLYANELSTDLSNALTGECLGAAVKLRTSEDKLRWFGTIKRSQADVFAVYVGDSATDLECLLEANVGICMRDEPIQSGQIALQKTCERSAIAVRWIGDYSTDNFAREESVLWWAGDFFEIKQWLEGFDDEI